MIFWKEWWVGEWSGVKLVLILRLEVMAAAMRSSESGSCVVDFLGRPGGLVSVESDAESSIIVDFLGRPRPEETVLSCSSGTVRPNLAASSMTISGERLFFFM